MVISRILDILGIVDLLGVDDLIQFSNFRRKRPKSKTLFKSVEASELDPGVFGSLGVDGVVDEDSGMGVVEDSEVGHNVDSLGVDGVIQFSNFSRRLTKSKKYFNGFKGLELDPGVVGLIDVGGVVVGRGVVEKLGWIVVVTVVVTGVGVIVLMRVVVDGAGLIVVVVLLVTVVVEGVGVIVVLLVTVVVDGVGLIVVNDVTVRVTVEGFGQTDFAADFHVAVGRIKVLTGLGIKLIAPI